MKVYRIPVGPFEMNSYIVQAENSNASILIDPGDDIDKIASVINKNELKPERIINTHNHIDHVRHLKKAQDRFNLPFFCCQEDLPLLEAIKDQGLLFGLEVSDVPEISGFVKDGDTFKLDNHEYHILHTPGHSPGSICLAFKGHVFVGDVLFMDSIGRTDLYGGNLDQLVKSIRDKLLVLPDDTIVYPGHGPETTIGREKTHNPFLK